MYIEICRHRVPNAWRHLTPVGEVQEAALRDPVELAKHNMKLRRGWKITAAMLGDDAALEQEHQAYAQRPQVEVLSCRIGEQLLSHQIHLGSLHIKKASLVFRCVHVQSPEFEAAMPQSMRGPSTCIPAGPTIHSNKRG